MNLEGAIAVLSYSTPRLNVHCKHLGLGVGAAGESGKHFLDGVELFGVGAGGIRGVVVDTLLVAGKLINVGGGPGWLGIVDGLEQDGNVGWDSVDVDLGDGGAVSGRSTGSNFLGLEFEGGKVEVIRLKMKGKLELKSSDNFYVSVSSKLQISAKLWVSR